jgi:hypothetical protein
MTDEDAFSISLGEESVVYWHMQFSGCIASLGERLTIATKRAERAEAERDAVYVQIECCADEIDILKHERDALRKDAARLNWLESAHTLQNNVEILYVVDGYNVDVIHHNGATRHRSLHGATLREALDFARAALTQEDA